MKRPFSFPRRWLEITRIHKPTLLLPFLLGLLLMRAASAVTITDPGQDVFDFTGSASELSGLAWQAGTTYFAVSDELNQRKISELGITLNPADGRITGASVVRTLTLAEGSDLEGIAWCRPRGTWFVSDEGQSPGGGFIREHILPDGNQLRAIEIPPPMLNTRQNFGFESCSWGAGALWTANEEALAQESALSTANPGSVVRLQKFDHAGRPAGQWAYLTDSFGFDNPQTTLERSGIADLLALPDGNLLVLERTLGIAFFPSFRNRIYLIGFAGATDTATLRDLDEAAYTPVTKTLLWEKNMGSVATRNFEGIALGPALPSIGDGSSYSALLLADNGGGTQQHLYALIINGVTAPSPVEQWRQGFWGSGNAAGPAAMDADPDDDGLPNLLEYALGGNPLGSSQTPLPQSSFTPQSGITLTFTRNTTNPDVTLVAQASHTLNGAWTDLAQSVNGGPMTPLLAGTGITETGAGAVREVQVREAYSLVSPRRYFRIKVIYSPDSP